MIRRYTLFPLLVAAFALTSTANPANPLSDQFQFNDPNPGLQVARSVATSATGDFAMAWQDGTLSYVQRFDILGRPLYRRGLLVGQGVVALVFDSADNLIVIDEAPDGSASGISAATYNRAGTAVVPKFRVNVTTAGWQAGPDVAVSPNGDFVVVWDSVGTESGTAMSRARLFHRDGSAASGELTVAGPTKGCGCPSVARDQLGNFVVAYTLEDLARRVGDVYLRRFDSAGSPLAPAQMVNITTPDLQRQARIAIEAGSGQFVLVWESLVSDVWRVNGQRFARDGSRLGSEFRVDSTATGGESQPEVAMADDGSFVVSWGGVRQAPSTFQVLARSYGYDGEPLGAPFVVRSGTTPTEFSSELAMDGAGNFAVTWTAFDAGNYDAFGRRFIRDGYDIVSLSNGQAVSGLNGTSFYWPPQGMMSRFAYYKISVPTGSTRLDVAISGGSGDADLYLRYALPPSATVWNGRPYLEGNNEAISVSQPAAGDWYIGVYAYSTFQE